MAGARERWVFNPKERMAEGMGWIASLSSQTFHMGHRGASSTPGSYSHKQLLLTPDKHRQTPSERPPQNL